MLSAHPVRSVLVLGGARSGKSRYGQALAEASGKSPVYIATARIEDEEMRARVTRHREDRGSEWRTVEASVQLAEVLRNEASAQRIVLVDCLTLWLSNSMFEGADIEEATGKLAAVVATLPGSVIFVSNEVGGGIVPENALARAFRDAQGRLNQAMAQACDAVVLVAAGLPHLLKPAPAPDLRL